jgi:uncharacterized protein (TIGR03435 family)
MRTVALLFFTAALSLSQTGNGGGRPSFEGADVHSASPNFFVPVMTGPFFAAGRYEIHYATMLDLIHTAYGVENDRISGGPSWLEFNRYEVVAKGPANASPEARRLMLQSLLEDRFKLKVHGDSKPMPAYKLTRGKDLKMTESAGGASGCELKIDQMRSPQAPDGGTQVIRLPLINYICHNTSMATLAEALPSVPTASQYFDNKPVVDKTELQGAWDFTLKFSPKLNGMPNGITISGENIPLFEALEKQLGLKVEAATVDMPGETVDSAQESPSPNPHGLDQLLPPPPTEFDVAEIKPAAPAQGAQTMPEIKNGRLMLPNMPLKTLLALAFEINPQSDIAGVPKWLDTNRFDLIAKAPAGVAMGDLMQSNRSLSVNITALTPMLRTLLIDRFKLQYHTEDRPGTVYTLVAVKPRMQKGDPTKRSKCSDPKPPQNVKSGGSMVFTITCQNVTMAQFASVIAQASSGSVRDQVHDGTGLEGGWDFTLSFSPSGLMMMTRNGEAPQMPGEPLGAAEPTGGMSFEDALQKQLGIKLDKQKKPVKTFVLDHIEEKPTGN